MIENVYQQIKEAKHPSENTQRFFKKNPYTRVWAMGKEGETLKDLRKKKLKAELWLGNPDSRDEERKKTGATKVRAFTGRRFSSVWHLLRGIPHSGYYVGLGKKGIGLWCVDVTDLFIDQYNRYGMCALHDHRHEFIQMSRLRKTCKFCGVVFKAKVVIKKELVWSKQ